MIRTIKSLNEMSFELPDAYKPVGEKYQLNNGQGFINSDNYLSDNGRVISLFEIHRQPKEFLKYYTSLTKKYRGDFDKVELAKSFTLKVSGFQLPVFILKGCGDKEIYFFQVFVDCGDCMACFMVTIDKFDKNIKTLLDSNPILQDLVAILRSVK